MVRVFISLSPWKKAGGAFICPLTDISLAWLERASFVNVRDRRDPAVSAAVARAARNGAVYCAKRGLQTAHSANPSKPFPHHAPMGAKRQGTTAQWAVAWYLTLANMGKRAGVTFHSRKRATLSYTKLLPQKF